MKSAKPYTQLHLHQVNRQHRRGSGFWKYGIERPSSLHQAGPDKPRANR